MSGSPGLTGPAGTIWKARSPGSGSEDQIGVPAGKAVPGKTLTVMIAVSSLKVAVSVAVPWARAVSCGGSAAVMLTMVGSLMLQAAAETGCPMSPIRAILRVFPTSRFAKLGVMSRLLGGGGGVALKVMLICELA